MSYIPQDGEDLVQCPYNKAHMIRIKRMPFHLMKCRREHVGTEYVSCPYNARHEMPKAELRFHMTVCEDRRQLEREIQHAQEAEAEDGTYFKGNTDVPTYFPDWNKPPPTENWDEEVPSIVKIGIDPRQLENANNPVFKNTTGMAPAEKKAYRLKLQRRHTRIQQGLPPADSDEEDEIQTSSAASLMRMPRQAPQVLQQQQFSQTVNGQAHLNGQAKPSIFEYSLSKAGLGRGIGGLNALNMNNPNKPDQPTQPINGNLSVRGQGRGAIRQGRGPPVSAAYMNGGLTSMMKGTQASQGLLQQQQQQIIGRSSMLASAVGRGVPAVTDENALLLQAMSRGRGRGTANYVPKIGNPPGFENKSRSRNVALGQFIDGGGGGEMSQPHGLSRPGQQPTFVVPMVTNSNNGIANYRLDTGDNIGQADGSTDSSFKEDEDQIRKQIKKLQKKIKGIEHLEDKQASGQALNEEELEKISKKEELEDMIQTLQ